MATITSERATLDRPVADPATAAISALIEAIAQAHQRKDAGALARLYAPEARIADLAPPLLRLGFDRTAFQAWLDGWDGPVELATRDLVVTPLGDVALVHGLQHTRARIRGGETAAWWSRLTLVLSCSDAGWRIVHHHESVPFHMDGSDRAALDLDP